jgi:hypothetical protein
MGSSGDRVAADLSQIAPALPLLVLLGISGEAEQHSGAEKRVRGKGRQPFSPPSTQKSGV